MTIPPHAPDHAQDPEVWAPRLARILDRQIELYERLAALASEQSSHIDSEDADALLEILGRREGLIEQISAINGEIGPFTQSWERLAPGLPSRHRIELRRRFDAVSALVERIATIDDADRQRLESRRAKIGREIEGLSNARGAVRAYNQPAPSASRFQDSRG